MPLPSLPTLPPNGPQGPQSAATPAPIHVARYARNGLLPNAVYETELGNSLNFAARIRRKNLFTWFAPIASIPSNDITSRVRWRFAAHTGPVLSKVKAQIVMARQDHGTAGDPFVTLAITNADESTTHASAVVKYGAATGGSGDTPSDFQAFEVTLSGVPADTDVYGYFEDGIDGRLVAATVYEEGLPIWQGNGYPQSQVSVTSPILDDRRQAMLEFASNLWKRGAAQLWNWSADLQSSPVSISSATFTNIIDATSTTVSAATPGATLDLRYCRTRARSTVPCVFAAYGKMSGGTSGAIRLLDSNGDTLAEIDAFTTTAGWHSTTVDLPAALDKLDVHIAGIGLQSVQIGAFSLYQYEA